MPQADGDDLARRMREATLEHLAAVVANTEPGSRSSNAAKAELTRREILTQQGVAKAQEEAARYTRENARWMFWSVIVVAVSSIVGLAWQIWSTPAGSWESHLVSSIVGLAWQIWGHH